MIRLLRSVTTFSGVPYLYSTYLKNNVAKSAADVLSRVGINNVYFVSRLTTVRITLKLSLVLVRDSGSPVIQSKLIYLNGAVITSSGTGKGYNFPYSL